LVGALSRFWDERGHLAEGRRRLESALGGDEHPTAARAKALNGAADMAVSLGDATTARLRAEEALALHRTLGDAWGTAESEFLLGLAVADEGNFARAQELFDESVRRFRELGDEHYTLVSTRMLAWTSYSLGERERGRALHEDNLHRARALGNEHIEASTLGALAMIALDEGRVEDAVAMLKERHRIHRNLGDPHGIAKDLCRVARVLAVEGRAATAARLLSSSEALHEEIGATLRPWLARMNEETLTTIRSQLDEAAVAEAWEQGQALTVEEAVALALDSLDRARRGAA
jgi:tetratricopeptide (TPR) repeat protein